MCCYLPVTCQRKMQEFTKVTRKSTQDNEFFTFLSKAFSLLPGDIAVGICDRLIPGTTMFIPGLVGVGKGPIAGVR